MALFDAFLKLDGIKGESADSKHKGEIDIMSFSWGVEQTGVQGFGGGGGAGKAKANDFVITKKVDASSPLLMLHCANGAHIKDVMIVCRKAGGDQLEFLKIKLTDVLVSSYKPHASAGALLPAVAPDPNGTNVVGLAAGSVRDEIPMESISLNFAKVELDYQPQGADGKASGGPIHGGWDIKGNVKV